MQQAAVAAAGFEHVEGLYISNLNTCGTTCTDSFSHNVEWLVAEALTVMKSAIDASTPFFLYFNPTPPHGSDAKNSLQDTSSSTGLGPYYCTATPEGSMGGAWTSTCSGSLTTAADFSEWCYS